jgi:hypothetical protein
VGRGKIRASDDPLHLSVSHAGREGRERQGVLDGLGVPHARISELEEPEHFRVEERPAAARARVLHAVAGVG